ncbi:DUF1073 domain-containing protein [Hyphomicrobiales bacterium BP6-180914]|uniref:DUF1073 domain-containing protein n=2 Tax=Lichenifustis flavocetrariae TaxID=2949735 RepID=A0AA41Z0A7_9HYPH|nr:anti-CBASS Acb1 family protein [Lichenifustis flavocetrariae]MCW6511409.1 DUF1073 domain-containing protein [Lichenifustis flavocetrariae]
MVRTFLQVAAGAADIPVTRLLGQSPAGLSATGDHDTRNTYDMIAARQEIELRPQLERLDRLLLASAGVAPGALAFTFRPLWQMDAAAQAAIALQKAQATQIYAGLGLWPKEVMAALVRGQLTEDGIYPNVGASFAATSLAGPITPSNALANASVLTNDYEGQGHDPNDWWSRGRKAGAPSVILASEAEEEEGQETGGPPPAVETQKTPRLNPLLGPQPGRSLASPALVIRPTEAIQGLGIGAGRPTAAASTSPQAGPPSNAKPSPQPTSEPTFTALGIPTQHAGHCRAGAVCKSWNTSRFVSKTE